MSIKNKITRHHRQNIINIYNQIFTSDILFRGLYMTFALICDINAQVCYNDPMMLDLRVIIKLKPEFAKAIVARKPCIIRPL